MKTYKYVIQVMPPDGTGYRAEMVLPVTEIKGDGESIILINNNAPVGVFPARYTIITLAEE